MNSQILLLSGIIGFIASAIYFRQALCWGIRYVSTAGRKSRRKKRPDADDTYRSAYASAVYDDTEPKQIYETADAN